MNYRLVIIAFTLSLMVSPAFAGSEDALRPTENGETAGGAADAFFWSWEKQDTAPDISRGDLASAKEPVLLAQNIDEMVEEALIGDLSNPDEVVGLETKLAETEAEKTRLEEELRELSRKIEEMSARPPLPPPTAGPAAGSDLFEALQKENAKLKEKLAEIESERMKAVAGREELQEKTRETSEELADLKMREQEDLKNQETIGELLTRVPEMEQELNQLRLALRRKDEILKDREKALQGMAVEIQRREHRLVKAERMSDMIEKAQSELKQVSSKEKRDMHYNMAAVYAREGKYEDAEREYLRALRIDPDDAESHYNLAILYDEHMDQKRRASMHYQRYLRLRPHAEDVDRVKEWLLALDMEVRD